MIKSKLLFLKFRNISQIAQTIKLRRPIDFHPVSITIEQDTPESIQERAILRKNRNARWPKRANHGARPCSSVMRRLKKKGYYQRKRHFKEGNPEDDEPF